MKLPDYFDQQAGEILKIANRRQEVVEERLANFRPVYPKSGLQEGEARLSLAIGIGEEGDFKWFGVAFDHETSSASVCIIPGEVTEVLDAADYRAVIEENDFNVLTFAPLAQIDTKDQLLEAIEKHANKYDIGTKQE